eukprot:6213876-Pleurochrysis_carterae.AAC.2
MPSYLGIKQMLWLRRCETNDLGRLISSRGLYVCAFNVELVARHRVFYLMPGQSTEESATLEDAGFGTPLRVGNREVSRIDVLTKGHIGFVCCRISITVALSYLKEASHHQDRGGQCYRGFSDDRRKAICCMPLRCDREVRGGRGSRPFARNAPRATESFVGAHLSGHGNKLTARSRKGIVISICFQPKPRESYKIENKAEAPAYVGVFSKQN